MNPVNEAEKLIKKYKTNNPFELMDYKKIYYTTADLGNIKGLYMFTENNKVILLNSNLEYDEKVVVAAHELGHAMMHPKTNCKFLKNYTLFSIDKIELQANIFCANLLLPNVSDYYGYTYETISKITHIPIEIVKLKKINLAQS